MLGNSEQHADAGQPVTVSTGAVAAPVAVTAAPPRQQQDATYASGTSAKDNGWATAYLVCWLIVTVAAIAAAINRGTDQNFGDLKFSDDWKNYKWTLKSLYPIVAFPLGAAAFTAVWLAVMSAFSQSIIKFCLVAHVAAWGMITAFAAVYGTPVGLIVGAICTTFAALYAWWVWRRVAFSEACLVSAISVFRMNKWPLFAHLMSAIFVGGMAFASCAAAMTVEHYTSGHAKAALLVLVLLIFMWSMQIHVNAAWVVSCSVAGQFLCTPAVPAPTWTAWKRSYTVLFGSICFGAFIEAAIRTLRIIVNYARNNQRDGSPMLACVLCCVDCLLQILSDIVEYVNSYAYVHVGLYGKDYRQAIRDTFHMFKTSGFDALINDDLTHLPMMVGVVLFAVSMVVSVAVFAPKSVGAPPGAIGIILAIAVILCATTVLTAYTKTLFVAWAQDVQALYTRNPAVCHRLTSAAREMPYTLVLPAA